MIQWNRDKKEIKLEIINKTIARVIKGKERWCRKEISIDKEDSV